MSQAGWVAATVAVGLGVGIAFTDPSAAAAPLRQAPCTAELIPTESLPAPTRLRIIGGGEFLDDVMDLWSGPNAGPEHESVDAEPLVAGSHPYFDQLTQRPDCLIAYSLRSQAQIEKYRHVQQVPVNYDPVVDAAKWQWASNDTTASNIRLPIRLERPASGSRRILIISDHRWDDKWFTEFKQPNGTPMGGWKWLQVTCAKSATNADQRICSEPQLVTMGDVDPKIQTTPPVLALVGAREYLGVGPNTTPAVRGCGDIHYGELVGEKWTGEVYGGLKVGTMGCFKVYANRWTRVWLEYTVTAGSDFAILRWWMADEVQEPVLILEKAELGYFSPFGEFWYEYDTSKEARLGGPMAAWGRNVVVLKDVADPTSVFARPTQ